MFILYITIFAGRMYFNDNCDEKEDEKNFQSIDGCTFSLKSLSWCKCK